MVVGASKSQDRFEAAPGRTELNLACVGQITHRLIELQARPTSQAVAQCSQSVDYWESTFVMQRCEHSIADNADLGAVRPHDCESRRDAIELTSMRIESPDEFALYIPPPQTMPLHQSVQR